MRIRMKEYEKLVEDHRALNAQFSDQCAENYRIRTEFETEHNTNCITIHNNSNELNAGKYRLENTRRHITLLQESHKRNTENIAVCDTEIVKVKEELEKLAADKVTMVARHKE